MKLLVIANHFHPEIGAVRTEYELVRELARRGYEITVLTTFPRSHRVPDGHILAKYRTQKFFHVEIERNALKVIRVKSFTPAREELGWRVLDLVSSITSLTVASLILNNDCDLVLTAGDIEFLASIPGIVYKSLKGKRMATILHDVHPKALVDAGLLKNALLISALELLEKFFYAKTDRIIVHSPGNKKLLAQRGASPSKVDVVYLWADLNLVKPAAHAPKIRREFEGKFIVSFAGMMQPVQGLEVIIEAARHLKRFNDILFLVAGEGAAKPQLIRRAAKYDIKNIVFLPLLPKSEYVELLQSSDVSLVTLRKGYSQPVVPSKLIEIMAAGCPVILCVPETSDAVRIVREARCGIWVPAGDAKALADAVLTLYNDRELARRMGENGRKFAEKHFSLEVAASRYERILQSLITRSPSK